MRKALSIAVLVLISITGCAGPAPLAPPASLATPAPTVMLSASTSAVAAVTTRSQGDMRLGAAQSISPEPAAAPTLAPTVIAPPQASPSPSPDPTAVKPTVKRPQVTLPDLGPASEFTGISQWVNSAPLTLASLRGKVVLVDFWTLGCYNCLNTLPYVTGWYEKYKDQGLVVIGVHTPEFAYERDTANVKNCDCAAQDRLPGGAGQRIRHMERLSQPLLARCLFRGCSGPHPAHPDRRGRLRKSGAGHPTAFG